MNIRKPEYRLLQCIKLLVLLIFLFVFEGIETKSVFGQVPKIKETPLYRDASATVEQRVKDLLSRMTLEEKIGQLSCQLGWEMYSKSGNKIAPSESFKKVVKEQNIGMIYGTLRADPWTQKTLKTGLTPVQAAAATNALQRYIIENTRLGIPLLLAEECAHGHMAIGTTVFPTSIGQGSTWDPDLIERMASSIAEETRIQGAHIGYGPILDIARDPRWSRVEETFGEDQYLTGRMGVAMVKGFQGNDLKSGVNIISTLKHFTAYGISEGGHNGGSVNVGQHELFQNFLTPFHEAVDAGALSIMTAYNTIDGTPCSSNRYLLTDVVRKEWGFNGFFISDLGAIPALVSGQRVTDTPAKATALAFNAGEDVDLGGNGYGKNLYDAIQSGLVSMSDIDVAVRKVLKLKFEIGLFENPYVDTKKAGEIVRNNDHIDLAGQVARESIILLKNKDNALPLRKNLKNIAVIGPNADNMYNQLGDYTAPQKENDIVTVLKGVKAKVSSATKITYVKGCSIRDTLENSITEAVDAAGKADVAILVLGGSSARDFRTDYETTGAASVSETKEKKMISDMECGEGFDRSSLDLLGKQSELLKRVTGTGTPVVLVLIEGRPLDLNWASENVQAIIQAWYPGQEGGKAISDVLFGDYNPAGRLPVSIPRSVGQLPVYYNYGSPERRNYVETVASPLYTFGYGLSYTRFEYSNLQMNVTGNKKNLTVNMKFDLKNIGDRDGDEVTQLYVRDLVGSVVTPMKQLKRFQRVSLKAGEQKTISFELNANDLALLNTEMQWVVEPGAFSLMIGSSSDNIRLNTKFTVNE
ncbi:MAG: glycoside hydrolase family 3 C-terminal domain-containing protein [Bacteroidales bacterium]|nr:glycoside hydrolase family 3 C-terminal domain-containing protein [Bacteroidales bacterium]